MLLDERRERLVMAYEVLIAGAGLVIACFHISSLFHHMILVTVLLAALAVTLDSLPVPIGQGMSSLLYALPIGALVVYGTAESMWLMVAASILSPLLTRRVASWVTYFFNAGQYVLSVLGMMYIYYWIVPPTHAVTLSWSVFVGVLVGTAVFVLLNHFFVQLLHAVRNDFSWTETWEVLRADSLFVLISLPFSFLMIVLSPSGSLLALLAVLPLVLLGQMMRMHRRTSFIQQIHNATARLTSEFDVERISEEAARLAVRLTYADTVVVGMLDEDTAVIRPLTIYPAEAAVDFNLNGAARSDGGATWDALDAGEGWVYVPDVRKDSRVKSDGVVEREQYLSMAIFPMRSHGQSQGAIVCYSRRAYGFGELTEEIRVLASQVGVLLENAKLYQELQRQSWRDGATGLYNYRFFYEALANRMQAARERKEEMSVVVIDVDYFKKFNDTYGHLAGDAVLKSLGSVLLSSLGPDAVAARYGGEEFGLILPCGPEEAFDVIERIRKTVGRHIVDFDGYKLQGITVSSGIASYPKHGESDRDLLLKADSAMYWGAKQRGRNRTALYAPEFDARLFVDGLTGLYTYHFVTIRTREALAAGAENWGAVCIDLAHFSEVNATFGFSTGNRVLQEASMVIRDCVRQDELACRYSGDDFLILLQNVSQEELEAVGQRVDRMLSSHRFECIDNVVLPLRAHYEICSFRDIESVEIMFEQIGQVFSSLNADSDESLA